MIVSKETFDNLRNEKLQNYRTESLFTIIKDLEDKLKEATKKNQNQIEPWPTEYTTHELEAIKTVIRKHNINHDNQPLLKNLSDALKKECPGLSTRLADALATVIRSHESRRGGNPKTFHKPTSEN